MTTNTTLFEDSEIKIVKTKVTDSATPPKSYGGYQIIAKDTDSGYMGDVTLNINPEEGASLRIGETAVLNVSKITDGEVTKFVTTIEGDLNVGGKVSCTDLNTIS